MHKLYLALKFRTLYFLLVLTLRIASAIAKQFYSPVGICADAEWDSRYKITRETSAAPMLSAG